MNIVFDIAEDELKIFLAEAEEQLQMLDEGLVRLEREGSNPELLQVIFRAAHTLKGSSGSIGHRRMAELTHAMETALDGLRKGTLAVSTPLIDTCLEAQDALRHLLNEVVEGEVSGIEITDLVRRLSDFVSTPARNVAPAAVAAPAAVPVSPPSVPTSRPAQPAAPRARAAGPSSARRRPEPKGKAAAGKGQRAAARTAATRRAKPSRTPAPARRANAPAPAAPPPAAAGRVRSTIPVQVEISQESVASAARAFQIMLSLQGLGEILKMEPTQAQIETATPTRRFTALLATDKTKEDIRQALAWISELDRILVGDEEINTTVEAGAAVSVSADISPNSIASAARALQLMMSLQTLGEIIRMEPSPAQIQTAAPVRHFDAQLVTGKSKEEIAQALAWISELDRVVVGSEEILGTPAPAAEKSGAAPAAAAPALSGARAPMSVDKTVRTSVERLDSLMNLVGELITDRNRLFQIRTGFEGRFRGDTQVENLVETSVHIGRITDQLQEEVMRIRMLPVSNVFNKFPRLVRDLARKAGKQVELVIRGEETELDRSVIEEISDPLIHLIRNAVDHGLEPPEERRTAGKPERGTISLTARHEESRIILTVEDDGRGINTGAVKASAVRKGLIGEAEAAGLSEDDAIQLIFKSGLSTAKVITDISGRGVGMDIVRTNIERLNGTILVETKAGQGTQFQVALPLTLAIVPALLVYVNDRMLAVPLASIVEAHRIPSANMHTVNGRKVVQLRGQVLPLVRLKDVLRTKTTFDESEPLAEREYVVAVRWGRMEMGLIVEKLVGEQELVIKPLGALVGDTAGVSGAAILGDGSVALIVDVPGLFKLAGG